MFISIRDRNAAIPVTLRRGDASRWVTPDGGVACGFTVAAIAIGLSMVTREACLCLQALMLLSKTEALKLS